ncbi:MAG: polyphosphate polymerase domain-containing protein [Oscillospiraceae bacterium]|nr:polyphosphate polymerase domain-containing protein [Oscillospiraceae bacterium]
MQDVCIFRRIEKKYLITQQQRAALLEQIASRLKPDEHGKSTVCSLYLDTPDWLLIRNSIEATTYKEKLRLRSYGTPGPDGRVFLELKKKYHGVVYKRRVALTQRQAEAYLRSGIKPFDSQIFRELDYAMRFYRNPRPAVALCYEREAFTVPETPNLRLTFDTHARYRADELDLRAGTAGKELLPPDEVILEIKTDGAMPMWLSRALDECAIRPASYSKYGEAYRDLCRRQGGENKTDNCKEVQRYA